MQQLNLPEYEFRLKKTGDQVSIFDEVRKKFVALTPEEWVRQNFVRFMIDHKNVPAGLVALEKSIVMNTMSRRPDVLIHDRAGKPVMVIECKSPDVKISQGAFDQVARYNAVLRVPYVVVTNGLDHYCCRMEFPDNTYTFLREIPDYGHMTGQG
ncbi:MAG TPA: type I restriction enzyme HsdR N-terminal domain-containing protein [Bacteroidales bacterium]|nr:type I restriction enzyme HsdR N-terminal domain-containing protein [Bacteroidales bacterium]